MLRSKVNSLGNPYSETGMRKRKGWGGFAEKEGFKPRVKE